MVCTFSGTFRWSDEKDGLLLKETLMAEPYLFKVGSKEAGQKWSEVAVKLNGYRLFKETPRDQRSVRDHFNRLLSDYKKKVQKEENASGIAPDPLTENEKILEDIIEIINSTPIRNESSSQKKKEEKRKIEASDCRDKAMTTWSAKAKKSHDSDSSSETEDDACKPVAKRRRRKVGSDALQFLSEKVLKENEIKKEEMELRREELRLQAQQQQHLQQLMDSQLKTQQMMFSIFQNMSKNKE